MKSILLLLSLFIVTAAADEKFHPKFHAFFNGMPDGPPAAEAQLLKDLGYQGMNQVYNGEKLAERVAAFQKHDLQVLSVYLPATEKPVETRLVEPIANGGMIELTVKTITPEIITSIRQTAEMASRLKIQVALYPHHGNAVATMPEALDLIEKVNHPNLGVMFNLCHYLKNEKAADLEALLEKARPHLFSVSTCGADLDGKDWGALIQTLDKGTFPQKRLLAALKKMGYQGPVTLQCYALKGDRRTNLKTSMTAWNQLLKNLP
ncbi:sugar phosphate isomerase/epimerase [Verrucomicrobiaceae bacterium 227]